MHSSLGQQQEDGNLRFNFPAAVALLKKALPLGITALGLDVESLVFAGSISAFMTMLVLVASRRGFPDSIGGMELWAGGSFAQALGGFLLTFYLFLPEWLTVLFGHTLLVLGQSLTYHAIRRFRGLRARPELHCR